MVHEGRLVAEHYADGIGVETPLIGWSMTKSVTNLLIGLLVADGQFCLLGGQWQEQLLPDQWMAYSTTPTPNNPRNGST